jgi:mRNA interferase MazF
MIAFSRGDIVLVSFVFSDESRAKLRPALVISSGAYHASRQEVIVAAITSNVRRRLLGDHPIDQWRAAGLLFPSVVTGIFRTIKQTAINRRLGALAERDQIAVDQELRRSLSL